MNALSEYYELLVRILKDSSLNNDQRRYGNILWKLIVQGDESFFEIMEEFLTLNDLWDSELGRFADEHTRLLMEMKDPFGDVQD